LTKAQIVEEVSERLRLTKKDIAEVIDLFFEIIKEGLRKKSKNWRICNRSKT